MSLSVVCMTALVVTAAHGGQKVRDLRGRAAVANARLDDAYYHCVDVQARSVVSPGQPLELGAPNFGALITLLKAVGSWVTFTDHPSASTLVLSLDNVSGPGSCLGTLVVARERLPDGRTKVLVGSGASVPGKGPPPLSPPGKPFW